MQHYCSSWLRQNHGAKLTKLNLKISDICINISLSVTKLKRIRTVHRLYIARLRVYCMLVLLQLQGALKKKHLKSRLSPTHIDKKKIDDFSQEIIRRKIYKLYEKKNFQQYI